jgi:hypothetical protein
MTEITQADREAARELLRSLSTGAQMVMGAGPGTLYETFARHRTTAHAEGFAQGYAAAKAQAVGVARSYESGLKGAPGWSMAFSAGFETGAIDTSNAIAQAIASMEPENKN